MAAGLGERGNDMRYSTISMSAGTGWTWVPY